MDAIEGIAVVIAGLIIGFLAIRAVWIDLTILAEHDRYELELALAEEAAEREQLTYVELVETD
jgi:5-bromo-4-chloroindolyl phosphate hydrolysis protein